MTTWQLYFASLVAMTLHPGYTKEGTERPSLESIAAMVDKMIEVEERCQS
jgi:hypothetical protein